MNRSTFATRPLTLTLVLALCSSAFAQLEITEIMYNTVAPDDDGWEWIEVRNTGGAPIDLLGSFLDRLNDPALDSGAVPNITANAMNTIIPAGGVAVIYDGFVDDGSPSNYDDQLFRDAWGLSASVPLIAADFFPPLANAGSSIGIWTSRAAYDMDINDMGTVDPEDDVVESFTNTIASIAYDDASPWPSGSSANGKSIEWSGNGVNTSGSEWSASAVDQRGAVLSTAAIGQGVINNTEDYANPGDVFSSASGTPSAGLYITEIMYNPASDEPNWEWVEVYNNTGAAIDFETTAYVFDDDDDASLTEANVTSGMIPDQGIAVLYNNVLTQEQVEAAWGDDINFIPVADFTSLAQGGDLVALWPSLAAYESETQSGPSSPRRTNDNAAAAVLYSNNANGFPDDNGSSSIYVSSFVDGGGELTGDYNGDGEVNNADYSIWRDTLGSTTDLRANGDDSNSVIDQADYDAWMAHFGETGGAGTTLTWALDVPPAGNSFSPDEVNGDISVHPGGDVASPGTFIPIALDGSGSAVVPEPASVVLMLIGAVVFGFLRRSR